MTNQQSAVKAALYKAYVLGQTYWQQADSDRPSQWKRSDKTQKLLEALVDETVAQLAQNPEEPQQ